MGQFKPMLAGVLFAAALQAPTFALAASGEDTLIEKFTMVYMKLAPNDSSKTGVTLRLADLHAERARKLAQEDLDAGAKDRKLALQYYREAVSKTPEESQARIWIQMGHLNEMNSDSAGALKSYEQVLKLPSSPEQQAEAHLSIAEVYFKQRNFPKAQAEYAQVVENPKAGSRGFAAYRSAWADFNLGKVDAGIAGLVKILRAPELLRRGSTPQGSVDRQFQEEVSRDLATFMAKRRVQTDDLNVLYELSPEDTKIANLMYLAGEAERLGQSAEALALWQFVHEKQSDPRERLESLIHIGGLQVSRGGGDAALESYEKALQLWNTLGCTDEKTCGELRLRVKNTLVDWNRLEKKSPSPQLVKAYEAYTVAFPEDTAMKMYLGQVARERKDLKLAFETFASLGAQKSDAQESALLSAIETAEMMNTAKQAADKASGVAKAAGPTDEELLLKRSYDLYVQHSPTKAQLAQIQYQQAKWLYDTADLEAAAVALRSYALNESKSESQVAQPKADLREQAANLALDSLAQLKDNTRIRSWADEFAVAFPKTADEKRSIGRKAALNQAATLAENKDNAAAWALLNKENFAGASAEEKTQILKNKLVLAEKLGLYSQARLLSDELLLQPGLAEEDRQYALSRKAWLSELVLDFDSALTATEKMKTAEITPEQRLLKLAMYADLASKEPRSFYVQYLKVSKDEPSRIAIASQLVKAAKDPVKELEAQKAVLASNPEVMAQLYLEIYGQKRSPDVLKKALSQPALVKTKAGALLQRQQFLKDYDVASQKLTAMNVDSSTQAKMAAGLKARVKALADTEKLGNQVIAAGDWTSQVAVLGLLAKEHERFYGEIMGLPLPSGLTPEEEQEYMQALAETSAPHQVKAKDLSAKVSEFWANAEAVSQLEKSLDQATVEVRPLIVDEIKLLANIAPEDKKMSLNAALNKPTAIVAEKPSVQVIEQARAAVRENPMDKQSLNNLLELETKWGKPAMVSYLKGRIETLSKEN